MHKSMRLKCEPSSEPLQVVVDPRNGTIAQAGTHAPKRKRQREPQTKTVIRRLSSASSYCPLT